MNLRQMEVFRAVMLTGTVAGASEVLHISQPSVSKSIALAERRANLKLFERVKGRLVASPEAKQLYAEVERLWVGVEKIRTLTSQLANPTRGVLDIGASPSLGSVLIPDAVTALYAQLPEFKVKINLLVPHLLLDAVVEHTVDVAFALCPLQHPNLVKVATYDCGWVCVMPPDHPLAQRKQVQPRDLVGLRLITLPLRMAYGVSPEALFGDVLDKLNFGMDVRAGQSACHFAAAGAGIAVVDEMTALGNAYPQLAVRPFKTKARLAITVAHNAYSPMTKAAQALCGHVHQRLARAGIRRKQDVPDAA